MFRFRLYWSLVLCLGMLQCGVSAFGARVELGQQAGLWLSRLDGAQVQLEKTSAGLSVRWSGGAGHSKIMFGQNEISPALSALRQKGEVARELVFRIGYDQSDYPMLQTYLFYDDNEVSQPFFVRLRQGVHDYRVVMKSHCRLSEVQIRGGAGEFVVAGISLVGKAQEPVLRKMSLSGRRKTREILLSGGGELSDFVIRPRERVKSGSCPLSVSVALSQGQLVITSRGRYAQAPKSLSTRRDSDVWADDALELFVSPQLDNRCYSQISVNAAGAVYDGEYSYDTVAAKYQHRASVNYDVDTSSDYVGGWLTLRARLNLKQLGLDVRKNPVVGFQVGQGFRAEKLYASWNGAVSNLNPEHYGLLYFNESPFGKGELEFQDISLEEATRTLRMTLQAREFGAGQYRLELLLTHPDHSIRKQVVTMALPPGTVSLSLPGIKDFNGLYTVLVKVYDRQNRVKPFVANFINQRAVLFPYGQRRLYPQPKQVTWGKGVFLAGRHSDLGLSPSATARTRKTAELLQEKLRGRGLNYAIHQRSGVPGITLEVVPGSTAPEGYHLTVTPEGVTVVAGDERGLFYGTVTLVQLMKLDMRRLNDAPIPCVEVVDAPDLRYRVAPLWLPDQLGMPIREPVTMEFLLDYLDRFVAGNKMNILKIRGHETLLRYDDIPRVNYGKANRTLTWADMTRLAKFCDDRFIDLMIALPGGGHDYWISLGNKEFTEVGYDSGNVSHPDYMKIYLKVAERLIDATHCKYFTAESDEWWHWRNPNVPTLPPTINGKSRKDIFLDFHLKLHDFLKQRGVRLCMYEDMINPMHSGPKHNTHDIVDRLPRDIILNIWADVGNAVEYFGKKGFECWGSTTGWITFDGASRAFVTGYGASLYGFGREWKYRNQETFGFHNIWFLSGNYAWNFQNKSLNWTYSDLMDEGGIAAAECVFAEPDNPWADEQVRTLNIQAVATARDARVRGGVRDICHLPTAVPPGGRHVLTDGKHAGVTIPVGQYCSSLIFLHTAVPGEKYKSKTLYNNRQWPLGYPVADYLVSYEDGTVEKIPVRLNMNIYFEGQQPQAGAPVFCRGMEIGYDESRRPFFLYQYEWVNPHPKLKIDTIRTAAPWNYDFQHKLFAVSTRMVKR